MIVGHDLAADASKFCSQFVEEACVKAGARPSAAASYLATPEAVCARPGARLVSQGLLHSYLVAHGGGKPKLYECKTMILDNTDSKPLLETERKMALHEGLATFLRNIATGDVEDEIDELKKEAKDIHTPEQQRYVITKIVRLLERLIILRHNPGFVQKQYHDAVSWFGRVLGRDSSVKELSVRIGEALRDLAQLRDHVLAKRWNDDKYNQEVEGLRIRVHGTKFNVNTSHEDRTVAVSLVEGSVALDSGEGEQRQLHPGEIARYNTATQKLDIRRGNVELESCWAAGKLVFERQSLGEICRYLSRWYDIRIDISPALAHNYAYTFTITDEPLEAILRIMSRINPIVYTFSDNRSVSISEIE
jgi:hypothetical protein